MKVITVGLSCLVASVVMIVAFISLDKAFRTPPVETMWYQFHFDKWYEQLLALGQPKELSFKESFVENWARLTTFVSDTWSYFISYLGVFFVYCAMEFRNISGFFTNMVRPAIRVWMLFCMFLVFIAALSLRAYRIVRYFNLRRSYVIANRDMQRVTAIYDAAAPPTAAQRLEVSQARALVHSYEQQLGHFEFRQTFSSYAAFFYNYSDALLFFLVVAGVSGFLEYLFHVIFVAILVIVTIRTLLSAGANIATVVLDNQLVGVQPIVPVEVAERAERMNATPLGPRTEVHEQLQALADAGPRVGRKGVGAGAPQASTSRNPTPSFVSGGFEGKKGKQKKERYLRSVIKAADLGAHDAHDRYIPSGEAKVTDVETGHWMRYTGERDLGRLMDFQDAHGKCAYVRYYQVGNQGWSKTVGYDHSTGTIILNPDIEEGGEYDFNEYADDDYPEWVNDRDSRSFEHTWEYEQDLYEGGGYDHRRSDDIDELVRKRRGGRGFESATEVVDLGEFESTGQATFGAGAPKLVEFAAVKPTVKVVAASATTSAPVKVAEAPKPDAPQAEIPSKPVEKEKQKAPEKSGQHEDAQTKVATTLKRLVCLYCGASGHVIAQCKRTICANCSKPGHVLVSCPLLKDSKGFESRGESPAYTTPDGVISVFDGEVKDDLFVCHGTLIGTPSGVRLIMPLHAVSNLKHDSKTFVITPSFGPLCGKTTLRIDKKLLHKMQIGSDGFASCTAAIAGFSALPLKSISRTLPPLGNCALAYRSQKYSVPGEPTFSTGSYRLAPDEKEYIAQYTSVKGSCGSPVLSIVDGKQCVVGFHYFGYEEAKGNGFLPVSEALFKFFTEASQAGSQ